MKYKDADEILDLVDKNDNVIGQMPRSEVYRLELNNFRVVNAFLVNDKKELWIPRRHEAKKLFPSCLDASVGGHVISGEYYEQAFKRELKEELNMDANSVRYFMAGKLNPSMHNVSAYMWVYVIYTNETPTYNQNDIGDSMWIAIDNLKIIMQQDGRYKSDLRPLILFIESYLKCLHPSSVAH